MVMPIAGIVISTQPNDVATACQQLAGFAGVEIHGSDERGNIVAVFDTETPDEMEALLQRVNACPVVLHAGVTYLNMEDVREEGVDVKSRQRHGCQQGET